MKNSPHVKRVISEFNKADLSISDKSLLISAILDRLAAIPLSDIIYTIDGKLFVSNREVALDEAQALRASAARVLGAKAFKLIREQVVYATFVKAAHSSATPEDLLFGKAAIWWGQQEDKYLKLLSNENRTGTPPTPGD